MSTPAQASFIGPYALNQFTLTNTNADGSVMSPDSGFTLILTGGNNGSGTPGTTDFVTVAAGSGPVTFQYSYSSLDFPRYDFGGYLLGGAFSTLAYFDGQSGTAMFNVTPGELFGFRVGTADNTGEAGVLTISNFTAPTNGGGPSVPEPGTATFLLAGAGIVMTARYRIKKLNHTKTGKRI